jgi:hypothetical protein
MPEGNHELKELDTCDYRNATLSEPIKLTTSDLVKYVSMPHTLIDHSSTVLRAKLQVVEGQLLVLLTSVLM